MAYKEAYATNLNKRNQKLLGQVLFPAYSLWTVLWLPPLLGLSPSGSWCPGNSVELGCLIVNGSCFAQLFLCSFGLALWCYNSVPGKSFRLEGVILVFTILMTLTLFSTNYWRVGVLFHGALAGTSGTGGTDLTLYMGIVVFLTLTYSFFQIRLSLSWMYTLLSMIMISTMSLPEGMSPELGWSSWFALVALAMCNWLVLRGRYAYEYHDRMEFLRVRRAKDDALAAREEAAKAKLETVAL